MKPLKTIVPTILREFILSVHFFKFQNHLRLLIYDQDFSEFQICLELTKHNIWISIQGGSLIWKLFNAPGPQWDQIEELFFMSWVQMNQKHVD